MKLPLLQQVCVLFVLGVACVASAASQPSTAAVPVQSVVLKLLDEADAPAQRPGVVVSIHAKEGDAVSKGQVLAELDPREAELAVKAARLELNIAAERAGNDIQVRYAAKAHETAAAELRRSEDSNATFKGTVSKSQLDVERLEVQKTLLEHEQAQHNQQLSNMEVNLKQAALDAAQLERLQRKIVSPLDGVIVEAPAKLGEWLEPGQLAFRMVNVRRLKAEGFVTAQEARRLTVGAPAELESAPGRDAIHRTRGLHQPRDQPGQQPGARVGGDRKQQPATPPGTARGDGNPGSCASKVAGRPTEGRVSQENHVRRVNSLAQSSIHP